ncbi:MAG: hypothetical protein H6R17_2780 [Proteobacteria bacterium]|nr:hypothetical protein [Pseudomonadota bacterium]
MLKNSLIALLLACVTFASSAALPPKYLGIKDFKQCLAVQQIGSYRAWCMPSEKPQSCPAASWDELKALAGSDRIPDCPIESTASPAAKPSESKTSE